ncbi:nucleotide exchange factor GrpE [Paroceanicella profunda]|uniref:Protein GrpE n=1 Tax=Paroceanicella profunda TaxID=2579971 RepID=A0A5B8FGR9_9RHOB|nr:nucleotide exchange factor GrpE [Paroceanicella profunda]QDL91317.1 nucleotide exchange factor GrpE [Paroceanicella profunda]
MTSNPQDDMRDEIEQPVEATVAEPEDALDPREAELLAVTTERDELKDRLLRSLAESENIRKRAERDRRDAEAYGGTKLARDLLSVHDNLGRALGMIDEEMREKLSAVVEGLELTQRELVATFAKHRIEKISPAVGDRFDPKLHQAMFEAPVPGAEPGSVIQVMVEGFTIADRLLRPAQVGVAAALPAEARADA